MISGSLFNCEESETREQHFLSAKRKEEEGHSFLLLGGRRGITTI